MVWPCKEKGGGICGEKSDGDGGAGWERARKTKTEMDG